MTLVDLKLTTCRSVTDTNTHCKTIFFWTLLFILKESIGRSQYSNSSLRYSKTFHLRYFTQSLLIDDKRVLLLKEKKERKRKLVNIYLHVFPLFSLTFVLCYAGGHFPDVYFGVQGQAWGTPVSPGTLHRGRVHQVQLKLGLCGRKSKIHSPG